MKKRNPTMTDMEILVRRIETALRTLDAARSKYDEYKKAMMENGDWSVYCESKGWDIEHGSEDLD